MTAEEIKSAIDAAIGAKVLLSYPQLLLFVILSVAAAFFGSYFKKKGENLALREDIERLTKIVEEIKMDYAKKLEELRYDIKVREQASKVAEYLSLRNSDKNDVFLMNKMSWELAFWLPAEIYEEMARVATSQPDAKEYKEMLIKVRKLLLNKQDDSLTWDKIVHTEWPKSPAFSACGYTFKHTVVKPEAWTHTQSGTSTDLAPS